MIQLEPLSQNRVYRVFLVDTSGAPIGGVSRAAGASIKLTKFGGSGADTANDLVAVTGITGAYTLQMNASELDTPGPLMINILTNTFATPFKQFVIDDNVSPAEDSSRYFIAAGGAAGYVTLDAAASATDNYYAGNGQDVVAVIVSGTGAGQTRLGTGYTGATKRLAVSPNWGTAPDATSIVKLFPYVGQIDAAEITAIQSGLATSSAVGGVQTDTTALRTDTARIIGLLQDNSMIDNITYGSNNIITLARVRVFANAGALAAAVPGHSNGADSEIQRYTITSVDGGSGQFTSFTKTRTL